MTSAQAIIILNALYQQALAAVDPLLIVPQHLPEPPKQGRTVVLGAGKAAARMALAVEKNWAGSLEGIVVTRYGHNEPCQKIKVIEAGHPVPDAAGMEAAKAMLQLAQTLGPDDLVIALISGGGSSLLTLPAPGLTLEHKREINKALLNSGASITEMNCVRRHLSAIKGGKLAEACGLARLHTLVVSDVRGDDPSVVASGPTIADSSSPEDALTILRRYHIMIPSEVERALLQQELTGNHNTRPRVSVPTASLPRRSRRSMQRPGMPHNWG
jgi:glycerate 2-kinase